MPALLGIYAQAGEDRRGWRLAVCYVQKRRRMEEIERRNIEELIAAQGASISS